MKLLATIFFPNYKISSILKEHLGDKYNHHNQFRIVCKARGIKHANELTEWICFQTYKNGWCCETKNKEELSFFEKDEKVNFIICGSYDRYVTDIELKKLLESKQTEKEGEK